MNTFDDALAKMARPLAALVFGAFLLGGCTGIASKTLNVLAKPILGLGVKDANTTLKWVKVQEAAGRLTEANVKLAKACPEAVLAVDALRAQIAGDEDEKIKGFKGLIYLATKARFGQSIKQEATFRVQELIAACGKLIPADRMIRGF